MRANYFFYQNDNRKVRIARSSSGVGSLVVCHSRSVVQPRCVCFTSILLMPLSDYRQFKKPFFHHHNVGNEPCRLFCIIFVINVLTCINVSYLDCRSNFTAIGVDESAISCQTLASNGNVEIGLPDPCSGYPSINSCPPLYLSVQSNTGGSAATTAVCTAGTLHHES